MNKELPKVYSPTETENKIYQLWEQSGYFNPDNLPGDGPAYTIILPPPNITDKLHLGHAMMLSIEDLLIRFYRLKGYKTLWLPGTDHAAIATQTVVEKRILAEEHLTKHDLGRDEFLKRVWKFIKETQATIIKQTRAMGASLDWSRLAFTLDEPRQNAVSQMFIQMYELGLIYRGERVVNWCPRCQSTLADDEVDYKPQKASLYYFKYDQDFPFSIATTRPETKLGDTAVAVNPKDKRYKKYLDQQLEANFCGINLKLKIIGDRKVETDFGTGALGVTPAHSLSDWQLAQENNLAMIKVVGEDGKIREGFGHFSGHSAEQARELIVKELKHQGLLEKEEEIENSLPTCYRCGTVIENLPNKQWFVDVNKKVEQLGGFSLKESAKKVVTAKKIKFTPERFTKRYLDWIDNLRDWCISRQIWFGHGLPVWYRGQEIHVGLEAPVGENWLKDQDTLDTWFSSGMWTFSTLGWPNNFVDQQKTGDLAKFHPTQVLETGYEIITLWVSRMIMMSLLAVNEIPFQEVYLHGMVLDEQGKKMSKSKGNGIDPLEMGEKYGTDAVRLSLLIGATPGNDLRINETKIASWRNFTNKFWNMARFIISKLDDDTDVKIINKQLTLADSWILSRLQTLISETDKKITSKQFSSAGENLIKFTIDEVADWYLEATKFLSGSETKKVLRLLLDNLLKLWHPFMPFITETIWQELGGNSLLMIEKWPTVNKKLINLESVADFDFIKEIISSIRQARSENKIEPAKKIKAVIYSDDKLEILKQQQDLIKNLRTGINEIVLARAGEKFEQEIFLNLASTEIYLLGAVDKLKEEERRKKEIKQLESLISAVESRLNDKNFTEKAPKQIVEQESVKLEKYKKELKKLGKIK